MLILANTSYKVLTSVCNKVWEKKSVRKLCFGYLDMIATCLQMYDSLQMTLEIINIFILVFYYKSKFYYKILIVKLYYKS